MTIVNATSRTEDRIFLLVSYLNEEWSERVKDNFLLDLSKCIEYIQWNPALFPIYDENRNIRRCVITKHNFLIYQIRDNDIQVLTIWDNRMDIESLNRLLTNN